MARAISTGAWNRIRSKVAQWEANTGRKISPAVMQAWINAELSAEAGKANENRRLDIEAENLSRLNKATESDIAFRNKQMDFTEKEAKKAATANTIRGAGELITGGVSTYALGKEAGLWGAKKAAPAVAKAVSPSVSTASTPAYNTTFNSAVPVANKAVSAPATEVASTATGGASVPWGPVTAAITAQTLFAGDTDTTFEGQPTGGVMEGKFFNDPWQGWVANKAGFDPTAGEKLDASLANKDYGKAFQRVPAAAQQWAMPGSQLGREFVGKTLGLGDVGEVLVDPTGFLFDKGGDTVICTELNKQEIMPNYMLRLEYDFKSQKVSDEVYAGYRKMADPIVKLMKKSKLFTKLVALIAMPWAEQMCHEVDKTYKSNALGKFIMKIGFPLCRWMGSRKERTCLTF